MELNKEQADALEKILGTDKACIMVNIHREDKEDTDPKLAFKIFAGNGSGLSVIERNAIEVAIKGMVWFAVSEGEKLSEYYHKFNSADEEISLEDMEPVGSA